MLYVRHQQTKGRVDTGCQWDQDCGNTEIEGDPTGVHRPATAKGNQGEVADVIATLRRDGFDRFLHFDVDNVQHTVRCVEQAQTKRLGDFLFQDTFRLELVQLHPAAEKMIRVENPDDHVGVGDRDLLATTVVADWTGIGAGAIRSDLQRAYGIDPRDGAAAGAHGVNVEHR